MLPRLDWTAGLPADLRSALPRAALDVETAAADIAPVLDAVRTRGDAAVVEATARFDGIELCELRVPAKVVAAALDALEPPVRSALETAIAHARRVHEAQLRSEHTTEVVPGAPSPSGTSRWTASGSTCRVAGTSIPAAS